jgi:hypothetical protein
MVDVASSALPASLLLAQQFVATAAAPPSAPVEPSPTHININAPFYISPAISFDPITSIVIVTFRDFETGEVREQIPPREVLSRYQSVDETGIPDPFLRARPNFVVKAAAAPAKAPEPTPAPTPAPSQGSGTIA